MLRPGSHQVNRRFRKHIHLDKDNFDLNIEVKKGACHAKDDKKEKITKKGERKR